MFAASSELSRHCFAAAETVKGQAENVKKEGGETTQSAKDMKAQDAMKNAGEMKDEEKKLKDAAMGK
jgi:hypothetical protein